MNGTKACRLAIFASGSGSNAENIIQYFQKEEQVKVVLVLTNNPSAYVLERAERLSVPSVCFTRQEMESGSLLQKLKENKIDLIVLAGFLWKIPSEIIEAYPHAIINIHPALLPKYGGKGMYGDKVHQAVVAAGETESGITIHYIDEQYDCGSTIFQAKCPVLPSDDYHQVAEKVHALEYRYYPEVIHNLLANRQQ